MRLFQNSGIYSAYLPRLNQLAAGKHTFRERLDAFLHDRYGASHFLEPVLSGDKSAFFTNGDDIALQEMWAKEHGMPENSPPQSILLAQVEDHRADVFYDLDPMRHQSAFVRRLPGCVKRSIAWRAAPSPGADFAAYDRVVCNFPGILKSYADKGWKAAFFSPAHDPVLDGYAPNDDRPIDILFIGGYSQHHRRRAQLLEAVASLDAKCSVVLHLQHSRLARFAESPIGRLLPLAKHRRPPAVRRVSEPAVFGRDMYSALSNAKIVLNGAVDMAGSDRGNMRCFEAFGGGCALLTDAGSYPDGMVNGETMLTYDDVGDAITKFSMLLDDSDFRSRISRSGNEMIRRSYSKQRQIEEFYELLT
ncbi:MAG: glycosyltransferase [Steroidobacteraceae bacterium]